METNGINDCIQRQVNSLNSKQCYTLDELYDNIEAKEVIVLGVFDEKRQSDYVQDQFFKAANSLGDSVRFKHIYTDSVSNVYDLELIKSMEGYSLPYILLIRPKHLWNEFEPKFVVHSFGDIIDFIKFNLYGLVGLRTSTAFDYFEPPVINIYSDIDYENQLKNIIDLRLKILELYHNQKDIKFIISDANKFTDELKKYYGFLSTEQILDSVPIVTAQDITGNRFLMNEKPFSIENLSKFVHNLKRQKLNLELNSGKHLVSDVNVKEVLAQEFEELVLNSGKESFIMFYNKDCDDCKRVAKTLETLGKALENEPNLQIVKQEFIAEYFAEQFKVDIFPTFYWFGKNKQNILYYGGHEFSDFIEFIAENSNHELKDFARLGHLKYIKEEL